MLGASKSRDQVCKKEEGKRRKGEEGKEEGKRRRKEMKREEMKKGEEEKRRRKEKKKREEGKRRGKRRRKEKKKGEEVSVSSENGQKKTEILPFKKKRPKKNQPIVLPSLQFLSIMVYGEKKTTPLGSSGDLQISS